MCQPDSTITDTVNELPKTDEQKKHLEICVGAFIQNTKGEIFLMRSPKWGGRLVVPGGHIEYGEQIEEAFRREVKEETNDDVEML